MNGLLFIDKPAGITSHDVIDRLRRATGIRRIGHAGTLDPFATGLLITGIGAATKSLASFSSLDKEYEGTMLLGATSATQDLTGAITPVKGARPPAEDEIQTVFCRFTGEILQIPPMFSAKKIGGRKLYELARRGETVERSPIPVKIHDLTLLDYAPPLVRFRVRCSSGTYIRTLAHDMGAALDTGAYLTELRRTAIGRFRVEDSTPISQVTPQNWRGLVIKYDIL